MLPSSHPQINPHAHPATPKTAKHQWRSNALDCGYHGVRYHAVRYHAVRYHGPEPLPP
jgi:hypothetical protein